VDPDAMALCLLMAIAPLLPPDPAASGWHLLASPGAFGEDLAPAPPERRFWDARLGIWRDHPDAFVAETPEAMACMFHTYAAPLGPSPGGELGLAGRR
jgi:hypothetical protein